MRRKERRKSKIGTGIYLLKIYFYEKEREESRCKTEPNYSLHDFLPGIESTIRVGQMSLSTKVFCTCLNMYTPFPSFSRKKMIFLSDSFTAIFCRSTNLKSVCVSHSVVMHSCFSWRSAYPPTFYSMDWIVNIGVQWLRVFAATSL